MLTLERFEEASEVVKQAISKTKLMQSDYLTEMTGNKVYLKPENMHEHSPRAKRRQALRERSFPLL